MGMQAPGIQVRPVYKVVLDISLDQAKVDRLQREGTLERHLREMATMLRNFPGVRHIEACVFRSWRSHPESTKEPWRPHGVLIYVESAEAAVLQRNVDAIFEAAKRFDLGMMGRDCIDIW
jgi:hypothetical protein